MVTILISCTVFVEYTNSDGWNGTEGRS